MSAVSIRIYPESWAAMNVEYAGQKYQPSNGSEGELFISSWCGQCERDHGMMKGLPLEECDDNQVCDIIARSFAHRMSIRRTCSMPPQSRPSRARQIVRGKHDPDRNRHGVSRRRAALLHEARRSSC